MSESSSSNERVTSLRLSPEQRLIWERFVDDGKLPTYWPISPEKEEAMNKRVAEALESFPEDERRLVESRYGFDGKGYKSFTQVGKEVGVSGDTIAQRIRRTNHAYHLMGRNFPDLQDYLPLGDESVAYKIAHLPILVGDLKPLREVVLGELNIAEDWVKLVGWEQEKFRENLADLLREDAKPYIENLSPQQVDFIGKRLATALENANNKKNKGIVEIPV